MDTTRLELEFLDASNKKITLRLDDPNIELSPMEIQTAMESIIAANVFMSKDGDLVAVDGARVVTTSINDMEF